MSGPNPDPEHEMIELEINGETANISERVILRHAPALYISVLADKASDVTDE